MEHQKEHISIHTLNQSFKDHLKDGETKYSTILDWQKRFEGLIHNNNDHMAHIRKDITDINNCLKNHVTDTIVFRERMNADLFDIKERINPMIQNYEDAEAMKRILSKRVEPVKEAGKWVVFIAAIIGALAVILNYLKNILK